jgi:leader peptidase (prepilin peptidase) / N-methyltransferase
MPRLDAIYTFLQDLFGPMRLIWAVFGACVGSFISVVVHRMPLILEAEERGVTPPCSLSTPPSTCPSCRQKLAFRDNLPILGYLTNKGRCRQCKTRIPPRYLLLELTAASWALFATFAWTDPVQVLAWSVFGWYLLAMAWLDAETQWLPDVLTLGLLWLGLLVGTTSGAITPAPSGIYSAVIVFSALTALSRGFAAIRGKDGLAGGDIKLMTAFAVWFGGVTAVYLVTTAFAIFIVQALVQRNKEASAFGPALCLSAIGFGIYLAR